MSEPTEMVLRVAKALDFRSAALAPLEYPGNPARLRAMARMAIRAMLEPETRMLEDAGTVEGWSDDTAWCLNPDDVHRAWWKAMISSALGEE